MLSPRGEPRSVWIPAWALPQLMCGLQAELHTTAAANSVGRDPAGLRAERAEGCQGQVMPHPWAGCGQARGTTLHCWPVSCTSISLMGHWEAAVTCHLCSCLSPMAQAVTLIPPSRCFSLSLTPKHVLCQEAAGGNSVQRVALQCQSGAHAEAEAGVSGAVPEPVCRALLTAASPAVPGRPLPALCRRPAGSEPPPPRPPPAETKRRDGGWTPQPLGSFSAGQWLPQGPRGTHWVLSSEPQGRGPAWPVLGGAGQGTSLVPTGVRCRQPPGVDRWAVLAFRAPGGHGQWARGPCGVGASRPQVDLGIRWVTVRKGGGPSSAPTCPTSEPVRMPSSSEERTGGHGGQADTPALPKPLPVLGAHSRDLRPSGDLRPPPFVFLAWPFLSHQEGLPRFTFLCGHICVTFPGRGSCSLRNRVARKPANSLWPLLWGAACAKGWGSWEQHPERAPSGRQSGSGWEASGRHARSTAQTRGLWDHVLASSWPRLWVP